jgi:hypothetical protein
MAPSPPTRRAVGLRQRAWPFLGATALLLAALLAARWRAGEGEGARPRMAAGATLLVLPDVGPQETQDVSDAGLRAVASLRGVVREADGGPAAGARVVCEGCRGEDGQGDDRHLSARTDSAGRFELPIVVPHGQRFRLVAEAHGQLGWAEAGRVGEEALLTLAGPTPVSGRVRGPGGKPIQGAAVVFSEALLTPVQLVTGMDGRFSGPVLPGLYQVTVVPDASQPRRTWTVLVPQEAALELSTGVPTP